MTRHISSNESCIQNIYILVTNLEPVYFELLIQQKLSRHSLKKRSQSDTEVIIRSVFLCLLGEPKGLIMWFLLVNTGKMLCDVFSVNL